MASALKRNRRPTVDMASTKVKMNHTRVDATLYDEDENSTSDDA